MSGFYFGNSHFTRIAAHITEAGTFRVVFFDVHVSTHGINNVSITVFIQIDEYNICLFLSLCRIVGQAGARSGLGIIKVEPGIKGGGSGTQRQSVVGRT